MKKVFLYGNLGKKFGREWQLNVRTVGECVKAIDANSDGFLAHLIKQERKGVSYVITTKKATEVKGRDDFISGNACRFPLKQDEIHICPTVAGGAVFIPIGKMFLTEAFFATTVGKITAAAIGMVVVVGATMLIQAIVESLIDMPEMGDPTSTKSYTFNGTENVTRQGVPVPIGYGRLLIGSTVIQSGLRSFDTMQAANASMLESFDQIEIFDLLSEGPIEGIVNNNGETTYDIEQGVYLNKMPVKNMPSAESGKAEASGTYNYVTNEGGTPIRVSRGNTFERLPLANTISRKTTGYSEQLIGPNPYSAGSSVHTLEDARRHEANVITHYIEDSFTVAAVINLKMTCAYMSTSTDHPIQKNTITFGIKIYDGSNHVSYADKGWSIQFRNSEIGPTDSGTLAEAKVSDGGTFKVSVVGIATSAYKMEIRVNLPEETGGGPRWIEIVRMTNEIKGNDARNMFQSMLNHIFEEKKYTLTYPNVAMANIKFDAKNLTAVPKREFHCKLLKIPIPSNYDPTSREYSGNWDGLFKGQRDELDSIAGIPDVKKFWTNNPAWVFHDLATNARYGLAKYGVGISEDLIDKWSLYKAAKYCDELVETGHSPEKPWRPFKTTSGSGRTLLIEIGDNGVKVTNNTCVVNAEPPTPPPTTGVGHSKVAVLPVDTRRIINIDSTRKLSKGMSVQGDGIPEGTFILSISTATSFTIDKTPTISTPENSHTTLYFQAFSMSNKEFKDEYGNGFSFKGRKIIFAIEDKYGRETFHERGIHSSDFHQRWVKVFAPKLALRQKNEEDASINGRCVCQFNYPIVEPRFTCNTYITQFQQALDLFKNLCAIFQGMVAYIDGRVGVVQEAPREPVVLLNNSNVSSEGFRYTGVDRSNRRTAVTVRYSDKYHNFKQDIAYEEDQTAIDRFGYNEASLVGVGITSPSQAKRMARFYLYVSQFETESVVFTTFLDGMYLKAGDIVEISDRNRQEKFVSGRLRAVDSENRFITIDKNINKPTVSYYGYEIIINNHQGNETFASIDKESLFAGEDPMDQDTLLDSFTTTQFSRFVGKITTPSTISDLMLKKNFTVDLDARRFESYSHGLIKGDIIFFDSDGTLPEPLIRGFAYIVSSVSESGHSFEVSVSPNTKVLLQSRGKDQVDNEGGLHYFINTSHSATTEALANVNLAAAWSVANNQLIEPLKHNEDYALTADDLNNIMAAQGDQKKFQQTGDITGGSDLIITDTTIEDNNNERLMSEGLVVTGEGLPKNTTVTSVIDDYSIKVSAFSEKNVSSAALTFQTYIESNNVDAPSWYYSDKFGHFYASTDSNGWVYTRGMGWIYVSAHAEPVPSGTAGFYYSHDILGWVWTKYPTDNQLLDNYTHYVDGDKLPELSKKWFALRYVNNQERLKDGVIYVYDTAVLAAKRYRFRIIASNEEDEIKIKLNYLDDLGATVADEITMLCADSANQSTVNLVQAFNEYGAQKEAENKFNPFRSSSLTKVGVNVFDRRGGLTGRKRKYCQVNSAVPITFTLVRPSGITSGDAESIQSVDLNANDPIIGSVRQYIDGELYRERSGEGIFAIPGETIGGYEILKRTSGQGYWLDVANTKTSPQDLTAPLAQSGDPLIGVPAFPNASVDGQIATLSVSSYINYDDNPMPFIGVTQGHKLGQEEEVQIYSNHSNLVGTEGEPSDYRGFCRIMKIGSDDLAGLDFYLLIGKTIDRASAALMGAGATGSIYRVSGPKIKPTPMFSQKFRIKGTKDNGDGSYEMVATEYNPYKFAAIEKNINIQKPRSYIPPQADMSIPDAPEDLELFDITFRPDQ